MDEEDLEALKDDRKLENTDTFKDAGFAGMRESMGDGSVSMLYTRLLAHGSRKPDVLESLIAPARSSIGQSLLQKQGWRPGQGIGPRVTARKLKWQEAKMGLGVTGPSRVMDEDEDMDGGEAGKHTFAPRDTKLVVYQAKDDREGLGFQKGMGMGRLPQSRKAGPCE
jgi:G patch domain-containing protein 1